MKGEIVRGESPPKHSKCGGGKFGNRPGQVPSIGDVPINELRRQRAATERASGGVITLDDNGIPTRKVG